MFVEEGGDPASGVACAVDVGTGLSAAPDSPPSLS